MAQATTIASWGNSDAVRIPRSILRSVGLSAGDRVNIQATAGGKIEIDPIPREHRRIRPESGVTFESLFAGYEPAQTSFDAWPDGDMVGAELDAWS